MTQKRESRYLHIGVEHTDSGATGPRRGEHGGRERAILSAKKLFTHPISKQPLTTTKKHQVLKNRPFRAKITTFGQKSGKFVTSTAVGILGNFDLGCVCVCTVCEKEWTVGL